VSCRLVVAEGGEDVTIKVSDEGGGIPRSGLASIWTYLYSTAKSQVQMETLQVRPGRAHMASVVANVAVAWFVGPLSTFGVSADASGESAWGYISLDTRLTVMRLARCRRRFGAGAFLLATCCAGMLLALS
jgi:hypothetical protein